MPKLLGFICGAAAGAVVGLVLAASVLAVWDRAEGVSISFSMLEQL